MPAYDLVLYEELEEIEQRLVALDVIDEATTARTLTDADNGRVIRCTNAAGCAITVGGLADGFGCMIVQKGAGVVTFVAAGGSTLNAYLGAAQTAGLNAQATIIKDGDGGTEYLLAGEIV
jgi:hypothetical protein